MTVITIAVAIVGTAARIALLFPRQSDSNKQPA
jgi:hypothetical protein